MNFLRFAAVGLLGVVVDGGAMLALMTTRLEPFEARLLSVPIAIFVTFQVNSLVTFEERRGNFWVYLTIQVLGIALNLAVFKAALPVLWPIPALLCGSAVSLAFNYVASSRFAFR